MTVEQLVIAAVVGIGGAAGAALIAAYASKRWGTGTLAKEVDEQEGRLIKTLTARLAVAEQDASDAKRLAHDTERKRQACEEEIGRVKRDLRDTEAELLDLYKQTRRSAPHSLVTRHADRVEEEA